MNSNNSPQKPSVPVDTVSKYQDILDQYSKQVTVLPDEEEPVSENQPIINPSEILQTVPPEAPVVPLVDNLASPVPPAPPLDLIPPSQSPVVETINDISPPETTSPISSNTVEKKSNFFKILFFISLFIFLGVASVLAFSFVNGSDTRNTTVPVVPVVTQPIETSEDKDFCFLNDNKYKINDTFPSADGCNVCTCGLDGTITCTEKACNE